MSLPSADAWRTFAEGGPVPEGLPSELAESWERCRAAGADVEHAIAPQVPDEDLQARLEATGPLLAATSPALDALSPSLQGSRVIVAVADPQGCVLKTWGSVFPDAPGLLPHLRPGVLLREGLTGTTAFSLSVASGHAATCEGREHYCVELHGLAEAALPVRDESAEAMGVLLLFGEAERDSAGGLLVLGRSCLRQAALERRADLLRRFREKQGRILATLMSTSASAVMLVGPRGYLRSLSPAALRILNVDLTQDLNRPIDQLARFDPPILSTLCSGHELLGVSVEVHSSTRSIRVTVDAAPLVEASGELLGTMLTFEERNPIRTRRRRESGQTARYTFQDIAGESDAMLRCEEMAKIAARSSVSVLLEGSSGTGKELFAQAIHNESVRSDGPFVSVNCAAIPAELIESELFGYEEGAFTGARRGGMIGKFEAASGGTIFLDEIGDMPLPVQAECLRVLENRSIVRVGQHDEIPVDIRVIAATNKKLADEVETGRFREDLYYRLGVFRISWPSLQERASEIPHLVEEFIERYNSENSRSVKGTAEGVMERFLAYEWPGNVRELKNAIEHAVMVDGDGWIGADDLPEELAQQLMSQETTLDASDPLLDQKKGIEKLRRDVEQGARDLYLRALRETDGNVQQAARVLGVSRATFYRKLRRFGIARADILRYLSESGK